MITYLDLVLLKGGDVVSVDICHSCQHYLGVRISIYIVGSLHDGSPHPPESRDKFLC